MDGAHRRIIASSTTCPEAIAVSTWKIDPAHTDILLSAKHMMVTTVRGKFDLLEGELELDEAEPTNSKGEIPGVCRQPPRPVRRGATNISVRPISLMRSTTPRSWPRRRGSSGSATATVFSYPTIHARVRRGRWS
jgi:hypothetical protein